MKINKKHIPYIIAAVIVLIVAVIVIRSCDLTDGYSRAQGKYEAITENTAAITAKLPDETQKDTDAIAARNEEIEKLKAQIAEKNKLLQQKDDTLTTLANARKEAKTDPEIITIMQQEIDVWKAKFTLACAEIEDKDKQIEALTLNLGNMQNIAYRYKIALEAAENQARACEEVRSQLAKKLKLNRLVNNGKSVVIVAAAAYLAYNFLKKK